MRSIGIVLILVSLLMAIAQLVVSTNQPFVYSGLSIAIVVCAIGALICYMSRSEEDDEYDEYDDKNNKGKNYR